MHEHIEGLIAAAFTAMHPDGSVEPGLIEAQLDLLVRNKVAGVFVNGSTGESLSLSIPERMEIAERWADAAPEGFKVIVHCGHTSLADCKEMAAHAQKIGAWGTGAMGPSFFRPETLSSLVDFCAELAACAPDLPFYYYHIPSKTGVHYPMTDFLEAAASMIPNLAGIKYTGDDLLDFNLCRRMDGGRFDLLFGCDEHLICGLALGARGAIGSTYNFAAPLYTRLIEAFDAGDLEKARGLQVQSQEMVHLFRRVDAPFLAVMKSVMRLVGVDCGPVRLPLKNPSKEQHDKLRAGLERIGFLDFRSK